MERAPSSAASGVATPFASSTNGSRMRDGQAQAGAKFSDYFDFSEPLTRLPSHRVLAQALDQDGTCALQRRLGRRHALRFVDERRGGGERHLVVSRMRDGQAQAGAKFSDYFDFSEPLTRLPSHRAK
jgi:transcriptional accessory protein Tex/SPT6